MSAIRNAIKMRNDRGQLALSIFLTAGFPNIKGFEDLVESVYDAGADLIELGIPFSDPIADGPVIQKSSHVALQNGMTLARIIEMSQRIKTRTRKPLILMGYANSVMQYGIERFIKDATTAAVDGIIIPDIPIDEDVSFWPGSSNGIDRIHLTTPTSPEERIRSIDAKSTGFIYCVSVTGTTGAREGFDSAILKNLERTYRLIKNNKMLVGFGISGKDSVRELKPYCDGVIVGSAVIRKLLKDTARHTETLDLVRELRHACDTSE